MIRRFINVFQQQKTPELLIELATYPNAYRLLANTKEGEMEMANKANLAIVCVAFVFVAAIVIGWIG